MVEVICVYVVNYCCQNIVKLNINKQKIKITLPCKTQLLPQKDGERVYFKLDINDHGLETCCHMEAITETFIITETRESQKSGHLSSTLLIMHSYL